MPCRHGFDLRKVDKGRDKSVLDEAVAFGL